MLPNLNPESELSKGGKGFGVKCLPSHQVHCTCESVSGVAGSSSSSEEELSSISSSEEW